MKIGTKMLFTKISALKKYLLILSGFILLILANTASGDKRYFLCGPDEDGCHDDFQYCMCIPYNETEANRPYCFNFDELTCTPLSQTPNCHPTFIYKNQGECLATLFQSEPAPPCSVTSHSFCLKNHSYMCDPDGNLSSCHHI